KMRQAKPARLAHPSPFRLHPSTVRGAFAIGRSNHDCSGRSRHSEISPMSVRNDFGFDFRETGSEAGILLKISIASTAVGPKRTKRGGSCRNSRCRTGDRAKDVN